MTSKNHEEVRHVHDSETNQERQQVHGAPHATARASDHSRDLPIDLKDRADTDCEEERPDGRRVCETSDPATEDDGSTGEQSERDEVPPSWAFIAGDRRNDRRSFRQTEVPLENRLSRATTAVREQPVPWSYLSSDCSSQNPRLTSKMKTLSGIPARYIEN